MRNGIPEQVKFTSSDSQKTRGVFNRATRRRFCKLSQQGKLMTTDFPHYLLVGKRK